MSVTVFPLDMLNVFDSIVFCACIYVVPLVPVCVFVPLSQHNNGQWHTTLGVLPQEHIRFYVTLRKVASYSNLHYPARVRAEMRVL